MLNNIGEVIPLDVIKALIESGMFSPLNVLLMGVIGVLVYFVFIKNSRATADVNATINGMRALIEEEREQTKTLSHTVYEIRREMEHEQEKTFALREEILALKQENLRLQNLVTQMESIVEQYKQEISELKSERGKKDESHIQ